MSNAGKVLTSTLWNQSGNIYVKVDGIQTQLDEEYNKYCPQLSAENSAKCVTGCTNTADSQIIYYWLEKDYSFTFEISSDDYFVWKADGEKYYCDGTSQVGEGTLSEVNNALKSDTKIANGNFIAALNYYCAVKNHSSYGKETSSSSVSTGAYEALGFDAYEWQDRDPAYFTEKKNAQNETVYELSEVGESIWREAIEYGEVLRVGIPGHAIYMDGYRYNETLGEYEYHLNYGWGVHSATRWYTVDELRDTVKASRFTLDLSPDIKVVVSNDRNDYYGGSIFRGVERINNILNEKTTTFTFSDAVKGSTITLEDRLLFTSKVNLQFVDLNCTVAVSDSIAFDSDYAMEFDMADGAIIVNSATADSAIQNDQDRVISVNMDSSYIYSGNYDAGISGIQSVLNVTSPYSYTAIDSSFFTSVSGNAVFAGGGDDIVDMKNYSATIGDLNLGGGKNTLSVENGSFFYGNYKGDAKSLTVNLSITNKDVTGPMIIMAGETGEDAFYAASEGVLNVDFNLAEDAVDTYELYYGKTAEDTQKFSVKLNAFGSSYTLDYSKQQDGGFKLVYDNEKLSLEYAPAGTPKLVSITQTPVVWTKDSVIVKAEFDAEAEKIYYSYSGKDGSWMVYDPAKGVKIEDNISVYFQAENKTGLRSRKEEWTVSNIDKNAPEIIVKGISDVWTRDDVELLVGADDKGGSNLSLVEYKLGENGTWTTIIAGSNLTITENCELFVRATDNVGNVAEESFSIANIDKTAPVLNSEPTVTVDGYKVTFTWDSAEDEGSKVRYRLTVNGVVYDVDGNSITIDTLRIGDYNYSVQAIDEVGNESVVKDGVQFHLDTEKDIENPTFNPANDPAFDPLAVSSATVSGYNVTLNWTAASDNVGVVKYIIAFDDGKHGTYEIAGDKTTAFFDRIRKGNHTYTITAVDAEGNRSQEKIEGSFKLDIEKDISAPAFNAKPVVSLNGRDVTISWIAYDNVEVVRYKIVMDGKEIFVDADVTSYTFEDMKLGYHDFKVYAYDAMNNESLPNSVQVNVLRDLNGEAMIIYGNAADWTNKDVVLTAITSDIYAVVEYSFDQKNWFIGNTAVIRENCDVYFRCLDSEGVLTLSEKIVVDKIDKENPEINISGNISGITNKDVVLTVNCTDNVTEHAVKTEYSFDGRTWYDVKNNSVVVTENTKVYFRAEDYAGNGTFKVIEVNNIDREGIPFEVYGNPVDWTNENAVLTVVPEDVNVRVAYSFDNTNYFDGNTFTVEENTSVRVKVTDEFGNVTEQTVVIDKIDKTAPVISNIDYEFVDKEHTMVIVKADFADNSGDLVREYRIDDGRWFKYDDEGVLMNFKGTIHFRATDGAGNTAYDEFVVDNINSVDYVFISEKYSYANVRNKKHSGIKLDYGKNAFAELNGFDHPEKMTAVMVDKNVYIDGFDDLSKTVAVSSAANYSKRSGNNKNYTDKFSAKSKNSITLSNVWQEELNVEYFKNVTVADHASLNSVTGGNVTESSNVKTSKNNGVKTVKVVEKQSVSAVGNIFVSSAEVGYINNYSKVDVLNADIIAIENNSGSYKLETTYVNGIEKSAKTTDKEKISGTVNLDEYSSVGLIRNYKTVTMSNSFVGEVINAQKTDIRKGFNYIGEYQGSSSKDTLTVNKNAILLIDGADFGGGKDKFVNNGLVIFDGEGVLNLESVVNNGEMAASDEVWNKLDFKAEVINLGNEAFTFRGSAYELADNSEAAALNWNTYSEIDGWLSKGIAFEDNVDYIKFKTDCESTLIVSGAFSANDEISVNGQRLYADMQGRYVVELAADSEFILKLERKDENSLSYQVALDI